MGFASPPACIALGISLAMHLVLSSYGWGALTPDPSTRPEGIAMPAFALQVKLLAAQSTPGDAQTPTRHPETAPLGSTKTAARQKITDHFIDAHAAGAGLANMPAHVVPDPATPPQHLMDGGVAALLPALAAASSPSSLPAPAPAPAPAPVPVPAPALAEAAGATEPISVSGALQDKLIPVQAATAPAPKPDAVILLSPPPLAPELAGAQHPPAAPEQALLDATYYPTRQLTVRPAPTSDPVIRLPPSWFEAFGLSVLTLYVNADGSVQKVVLRSTTLPPELQQSVIDAFQSLIFTPGEIDGRPVASFMSIEANVAMLFSRR